MPSDDIDPFDPEKGRGILTRGDREFLLETKGSLTHPKARGATQKRHRIRSRIRNGVTDFVIISRYLSEKDNKLIFEGIEENEEFVNGLVGFLRFLYRGNDFAPSDNIFENLIIRAIEEEEEMRVREQMSEERTEANPTTRAEVDVDLDITVNEVVDPEIAYDKFEIDGDLTSEEIAALLETGKVSETEELHRLAKLARGEEPEPPLPSENENNRPNREET